MDHDHDSADLPGLKQAELREAAHEGPHGSHADGHLGAVEEHDARNSSHKMDHAAMGHTPEEHAAMGHSAAADGATRHDGMDHSQMDHSGEGPRAATTTTTP